MKNGKVETIDELLDLVMLGGKYPKLAEIAENLVTIKTWIASTNFDDETKLHTERYILAMLSEASSRGFEGLRAMASTIANRPEVKKWGRGQHFS